MNRFLLLLAAAAVAGAMYVAAAPGGRTLTRSSPTTAQFKALSKKVTRLQKQVTNLKKEADAAVVIEGLCIMHQPVGVDQVGTSTTGYLFGPPQAAGTSVTATATGALNLAPTTETTPQYKFFALNTSQAACVQFASGASTLSVERSVAALAAHR